MKTIRINYGTKPLLLSNKRPFVLMAGLCVIENERHTMQVAGRLKSIASKLGISLVFKASYDKANRSAISSYRGPGYENGLEILSKVRKEYNLPIIVDVHCITQVKRTSETADILQIPAFLCRQTDLLVACAKTGLPVNVKKGQFLAPEDTANIVRKISHAGNSNIILTERGSSFGYHNLVVDMRSIEIMKKLGCPVVFDATHSVQQPGGMGTSTGGQREFVLPLAEAAVALGIAGVFIEVHPNPERALSDGPNSLKLSELERFLKPLIEIDRLVKGRKIK